MAIVIRGSAKEKSVGRSLTVLNSLQPLWCISVREADDASCATPAAAEHASLQLVLQAAVYFTAHQDEGLNNSGVSEPLQL